MSIPSYPGANDAVIGTDDPLYDNTWDNVNIAVQSAFEVDHIDGVNHLFGSTYGPCLIETGTYVGDHEDNNEVTLSNSDLNVLFVLVAPGTTGSQLWVGHIASMPDGYSLTMTNTQQVDQSYWFGTVDSVGTGFFRVGDATNTNNTGVTYTYVVFGIPSSIVAGDTDFTPSWIQHNESIILDGNSDGAPTRASKQILAKYRVEHGDDGNHPFGYIEVGTYTGNGSTQIISTQFPPLFVAVGATSNTRRVVTRISSMPDGYAKDGGGGALEELISTGDDNFTLTTADDDTNFAGRVYYYVAFG